MNNIVNEKRFISSTLALPYENLSQSYLRAETALTSNQSVIPFKLQKGKNSAPVVTERLLDLNDEFVITHLFVGLKGLSGAASDATQVNAVVETYNSVPFTTPANGEAFYNGNLEFTIDRKEYVPQFPMRAFKRVPDTQTATDADYTGSGIDTVNAYGNGLYGFYAFEPTKIDGRQTLDINVNIGTSVDLTGSNPIYAVLIARGYLIVNSKS